MTEMHTWHVKVSTYSFECHQNLQIFSLPTQLNQVHKLAKSGGRVPIAKCDKTRCKEFQEMVILNHCSALFYLLTSWTTKIIYLLINFVQPDQERTAVNHRVG